MAERKVLPNPIQLSSRPHTSILAGREQPGRDHKVGQASGSQGSSRIDRGVSAYISNSFARFLQSQRMLLDSDWGRTIALGSFQPDSRCVFQRLTGFPYSTSRVCFTIPGSISGRPVCIGTNKSGSISFTICLISSPGTIISLDGWLTHS